MPDQDPIFINGIDGTTGQPAFAPLTVADIVSKLTAPSPGYGIGHGGGGHVIHRAAEDIAESGWAVVIPKGTDPAILHAIEPLRKHREAQAGDLYREIDFDPATDDFAAFLKRHGVSPGNREHASLPKYLLLLGPPTSIPFEFQGLLGLEYGPGRLDFRTPDEYRAYAESVVAYERSSACPTAREICFWGPRRDPSTELSSTGLLGPLIEGYGRTRSVIKEASVGARELLGDDALKDALLSEMHRPPGMKPPTLFFAASHGVSWPSGDERQRSEQGALVTADWYPGLPVSSDSMVAASDVTDDARVHGTIAFMFACFGAATPEVDSFPLDRVEPPKALAPAPFVSPLPQRLLAHPGGGALGVFGHVDRAWGFSLQTASDVPQIGPFRNGILRALRGAPLGDVLSDFALRAAGLSSKLVTTLGTTGLFAPSDKELALSFIERNDAMGYMLLGDPGASVIKGSP
jgi:hypothetical protein